MASTNEWHNVWNSKSGLIDENISLLPQLIKLNGFDTGVGDFSIDDWFELTKKICEDGKLKKESSVFEIGCGSGHFFIL